MEKNIKITRGDTYFSSLTIETLDGTAVDIWWTTYYLLKAATA